MPNWRYCRSYWELGNATVRQVHEAISSRRPVAYTTTMTMLGLLVKKGHLRRGGGWPRLRLPPRALEEPGRRENARRLRGASLARFRPAARPRARSRPQALKKGPRRDRAHSGRGGATMTPLLAGLAAWWIQCAILLGAGLVVPGVLGLRAPAIRLRLGQALLCAALLLPVLQPRRTAPAAGPAASAVALLAITAAEPSAQSPSMEAVVLAVLGGGALIRVAFLAAGLHSAALHTAARMAFLRGASRRCRRGCTYENTRGCARLRRRLLASDRRCYTARRPRADGLRGASALDERQSRCPRISRALAAPTAAPVLFSSRSSSARCSGTNPPAWAVLSRVQRDSERAR